MKEYLHGHLATLILDAFLRSQCCQSSAHGFRFHVESYEIGIEVYDRDCESREAHHPEWKYLARYLRPVTRSPLITPCGQFATPQRVLPVLQISSAEDWFQLHPKAIGRRMAPVQELILNNYNCKQLGQDIGDLWDLTQLRSLSLEGVRCINSPEDLPTMQLANLQILKLEFVTKGIEEISQRIVGNLIGRLESLEILKLLLPGDSAINTSALFKHGGGKLRQLQLLSMSPPVSEMKEICQYCPYVVDVQFWLPYKEPQWQVFPEEESLRIFG